MNSSYTPSWMIRRVPDTHVWPEATKEANAAPFTALTTSASLKITMGACTKYVVSQLALRQIITILTLPPSSAV